MDERSDKNVRQSPSPARQNQFPKSAEVLSIWCGDLLVVLGALPLLLSTASPVETTNPETSRDAPGGKTTFDSRV